MLASSSCSSQTTPQCTCQRPITRLRRASRVHNLNLSGPTNTCTSWRTLSNKLLIVWLNYISSLVTLIMSPINRADSMPTKKYLRGWCREATPRVESGILNMCRSRSSSNSWATKLQPSRKKHANSVKCSHLSPSHRLTLRIWQLRVACLQRFTT